MKGPSRVRACVAVCASLGVVALSLVATAPARAAWTQLTPKLTEPQAKALAPKVANILRQGGDAKLIDQYFDQYYFPAMTAGSPQGLAKIGDLRRNLFRQYLDSAQSAEARAHLNELASKRMAAIALGNYHPSVRYNAVLVMGQLTTEPPRAGAAPKPLPLATDMLLKLVELEEVKGVPIQSSVKVAALVGLERHALLGFDPKFADRMTKAALDVASRKDAPEDTTSQVYDWMRGQAVRVLANQYAKGVTQPVADAVAAILANDKISVDQRCRIADSLKSDMFKGAKGVKLDALVLALGTLASDSLNAESKKAAKYEEKATSDPNIGFGGGGGGRGGYGGGGRGGYGGGGRGGFGGGFGEEDTGPKYEKRRALQRIMAVANAAAAVSVGELSDELKGRVTELGAALTKVADLIVDKDQTDLDVTAAVIALSQQVDDMVATWSGKPAPADGKAKDDAFGAAG